MSVLLLEDEFQVRRMMRAILKDRAILEARDAAEAWQLFQESAGAVELLIADLTLPDGSGVQLAGRFRQQQPGLPVILSSGLPVAGWPAADAAEFDRLRSPSVIFLQKPFRAAALLESVCRLIGGVAAGTAGGPASQPI